MGTKHSNVSDETMHVQFVEGEAVSLLTSKTGTWRAMRPLVREGIAPCTNACPAGIGIRDYLALLADGKTTEAAVLLKEANPLAAITGRVCPGFCEPECNRGEFDQPIAIRPIERLLGDYGLRQGFGGSDSPARGEQVAIIGSGPAGLTAAYFLARYGYRLTIFEALPVAGGMLYWGIPDYRLPKSIIEEEITAIKNLGVEIITNTRIGGELSLSDLFARGYKAVLIAIGAWTNLKLNISGEGAEGVISGAELLKRFNSGDKVALGKKVFVIGGGNTAIDSARVAARLGVKRVTVLYRRSRAEMPAIVEEVEAALAEDVEIKFLVAPTEILAQDGRVAGIRCVRMKLGEPDSTGRKKPIPISSSEFNLDADTVVTAIGQVPDLSLFQGLKVGTHPEGTIVANPNSLKTNLPKIFVAGDAQTGPATVIQAVASGKKAALGIHSWLSGTEIPPSPNSQPVVSYRDLNVSCFDREPRQELKEAKFEASKSALVREAQRCFYCGRCNLCNTCWFLCPDSAIKSLEEEIEIDYDYCKGCCICVEECPRGALVMEEESKWQ